MPVLPNFSADSRERSTRSRVNSHSQPHSDKQLTPENAPYPQLLVSIRSPQEAKAALRAGPRYLDIKEPDHGSLGFAGPKTISDIAKAIRGNANGVSLSAALGELTEWEDSRPIPCLPRDIQFAKMGLANCGESTSWLSRWIDLRQRFEHASQSRFRWIAVHYVDASAKCPPLAAILEAALSTGATGLLLDTHHKGAGSLFSHISQRELLACRDATRRANQLLALAGSLKIKDLPRVAEIGPDIVALRGAVCRGGVRTGPIDEHAIRNWIAQLQAPHPMLRNGE